jgi:hypothetical protein
VTSKIPWNDRTFGRESARAWTEYQVKGNLLAARPRYVKEQWGDDAFRDVAKRLDASVRPAFDGTILPFAWHSFGDLAAIDSAIIDGPMHGDMSKMKHFGATIARYDLSTLYRMLFKLGSPEFVIRRVAVVYRTYVKGGGIAASDVRTGEASVRLTEGALPRYFCSHGVAGWFTAAIELSGGKEVNVRETTCIHDGAEHCAWHATWA